VRRIEWTDASLEEMAGLDKGLSRRVKQAIERVAVTGAGDVKKLQGIDPPEFRLRVGDYRVRFHQDGGTIRILRVRNRKEAYRD
jgi:mRNA-degrading endonuclease RelE of RelBE toxin-antitoxin system